MKFPSGYEFGMTPNIMSRNWPQLKEKVNFNFTSLRNKTYNCVAHAMGIEDDWICMYTYAEKLNINPEVLDHSAYGYSEILENYGFVICEDPSFEEGFVKVAIYEDSKQRFTHASRLLDNGKWTSKMGRLEDIEHDSISVLESKRTGTPAIYMKRRKDHKITLRLEEIKLKAALEFFQKNPSKNVWKD